MVTVTSDGPIGNDPFTLYSFNRFINIDCETENYQNSEVSVAVYDTAGR